MCKFGKSIKNSCVNGANMGKLVYFAYKRPFCPCYFGFRLIMPYSAPKQTTFFVILLISLLLHIIFFVISSNRLQTENHRMIADRLVAEMSADLVMPSAANDRVSMSYIASQYAKEPEVAYVGVYNAADNIVVSVGEGESGYRTKNETIISGDKVLGSAVIETKAVRTASILSGQWLFLLAMLVLHGLIWVAYSYFARPSKELKAQIASQTRAKLISQGVISGTLPVAEVAESVQVQTAVADDIQDDDDKEQEMPVAAPKVADSYVTQVRFDDPNGLLLALSFDHKQMYFALCDQMLAKAAQKLLDAPLLAGVSIHSIKSFDENGASVTLVAEHEHAKVATASLMLAKLALMVNQIVYERHRKQGQFALNISTMASDSAQANTVHSISARRGLPLVLLFDSAAKQEIATVGVLDTLDKPLSASERDCQVVSSLNQSAVTRLRVARDAVFLEE